MRDRSSRPHPSPTRLVAEATAGIEALRRQRRTGPAIARQLGLPGSTVGLTLRRLDLGRLAALDSRPVVVRYQREHSCELMHIDMEEPDRTDGIGHRTGQSNRRGKDRECLHVAIGDASQPALAAMPPDKRRGSAKAFLDTAPAWLESRGVMPSGSWPTKVPK